ncbi:beta-lactamase family protein [Octadecabacter sp.]|nr:beta-lactamase family protein [Octadecabacter sp.]
MKPILRWILMGLLVLIVVATGIGLWQREKLTRLMAVNSLFSESRIVGNFIAMNTMFEQAEMPLSDVPPNRLETGAPMDLPAGFTDWTAERSVTAVIVVKDGIIRHESYPLTADGEDDPASSLRISWSVAKSYLSTLMGVLHDDGTIPDLDAPVTQYAPSLAGSAYDGASIRDVLQMSSGVTFNEDYLDFWSDINKMGRVLALGRSMDGFAAGLTETYAPSGENWQYVSIDTHVIGMVIRGATGRNVPELLNEKVLTPLRMGQAPYYLTDGYGVAFVLGGLNITTHDYALFGHMIASGGISFGTRIVSEDWIVESTTPSANTAEGEFKYGYQWWIPEDATDGQFMGRGIYGQYIYIDRPRGVVIAVNGADRAFREDGVSDQNVDLFRQIAESFE